ncbi:ribosomal L7Ae/L30e/S12e/Gadd45 family protein [Candidatus Woesearchaeota archaeon]|nr:ribosomal L7Ae/L30e/S12e/Gadd45 family protein [Candidatus Woesearchaeota archaeon]
MAEASKETIEKVCKEKNIACVKVTSREELGAAAGLDVPTVSVAIVNEGEAKDLLKEITNSLR